MTTQTLSMSDLVALEYIAGAAQHTAWIKYTADGTNVVEGVARHICRDREFNFLRSGDDVRDGFLRVSGLMEYAFPVRALMTAVHEGRFVVEAL